MGELNAETAQLRSRLVTVAQADEFRNGIIGLIRENGCRLRSVTPGDHEVRRWMEGDDLESDGFVLGDFEEEPLPTPYSLVSQSLNVQVSGSFENIRSLVDAVQGLHRAAQTRTLVVQADSELGLLLDWDLPFYDLEPVGTIHDWQADRGHRSELQIRAAGLGFCGGPHFLQPFHGHCQGILFPQCRAEQFQRHKAAVFDLPQQVTVTFQVDHTVARHDTIRVALCGRRWFGRGIVEVGHSHLLRPQSTDGFHAAFPHVAVERIEHHAGLGVSAAVDDLNGVIDGFEVRDEAQVFESRPYAEFGTQLQQLVIVPHSQWPIGRSVGRARHRMRSPHRLRLFEFASGNVHGGDVFIAGRLKPVMDVDGGGHLQAVILHAFADIANLTAAGHVSVHIVVPQLNSGVARFGGDGDLVENRRGFDGAGVQAVGKAHESGGPL